MKDENIIKIGLGHTDLYINLLGDFMRIILFKGCEMKHKGLNSNQEWQFLYMLPEAIKIFMKSLTCHIKF